MVKDEKQKNGFTRLGFSSSFGCCGHFYLCDMGKGNCIYAEIDPGAMRGCKAWQRNHHSDIPTLVSVPSEVSIKKEIEPDSFEQLSLFD